MKVSVVAPLAVALALLATPALACFKAEELQANVQHGAVVEQMSKAEDKAFHQKVEETEGVVVPDHDAAYVVHNDEVAQTVIFKDGCGVAKSGLMPLEVFESAAGRKRS